MSKKQRLFYTIVIIILTIILIYITVMFFVMVQFGKNMAELDKQAFLDSNFNAMEITFSNKQYVVGNAGPHQESDFITDSREWVTDGETVENWTSLITTHRLTPITPTPLSAAAYAQNVANLQAQNGALVLETSLINQDMEALGIDPNNPPYLLVYLYEQNGVTEFNMQKIIQLNELEVGSIIYAERFPTKTEPEMQAYYESKERTDKRIELIKFAFPY